MFLRQRKVDETGCGGVEIPLQIDYSHQPLSYGTLSYVTDQGSDYPMLSPYLKATKDSMLDEQSVVSCCSQWTENGVITTEN